MYEPTSNQPTPNRQPDPSALIERSQLRRCIPTWAAASAVAVVGALAVGVGAVVMAGGTEPPPPPPPCVNTQISGLVATSPAPCPIDEDKDTVDGTSTIDTNTNGGGTVDTANTANTNTNGGGTVDTTHTSTVKAGSDEATEPACADYVAVDGGPLELCDRGASVERLQLALLEHGHDIDADGFFGPATHQAVRDYQAAAGLGVDGIAGPNTHEALGLSNTPLPSAGHARINGVDHPIAATCSIHPIPGYGHYLVSDHVIDTPSGRWVIERWYDEGDAHGVAIVEPNASTATQIHHFDHRDGSFDVTTSNGDRIALMPSGVESCGRTITTTPVDEILPEHHHSILDVCLTISDHGLGIHGIATEGLDFSVVENGNGAGTTVLGIDSDLPDVERSATVDDAEIIWQYDSIYATAAIQLDGAPQWITIEVDADTRECAPGDLAG